MSLVRTRAVAVHSLSATEFVDQRTAVTEDRTVVLFWWHAIVVVKEPHAPITVLLPYLLDC